MKKDNKLVKAIIILLCFMVFIASNVFVTIIVSLSALPNGDGSQNKYLRDLFLIVPMVTIPITLVNLFLSKIGFKVHKSEMIYKISQIICYIACLFYASLLVYIVLSHVVMYP